MTMLSRLSDLSLEKLMEVCTDLRNKASEVLAEQGVAVSAQSQSWEADCRFKGQATNLPVSFSLDEITAAGVSILADRYALEKNMFCTLLI